MTGTGCALHVEYEGCACTDVAVVGPFQLIPNRFYTKGKAKAMLSFDDAHAAGLQS